MQPKSQKTVMQLPVTMLLLLGLLALTVALVDGVAGVEVASTTTAPPHPPPSPTPHSADFRGRVAFACQPGQAYPAMTWTEKGWRQDKTRLDCPKDLDSVRRYCRLQYPTLLVHNVEPAVDEETIGPWCTIDSVGECPREHLGLRVRPYECLSGDYQSPALLVEQNCKFLHQSSDMPKNRSSCHLNSYWEARAAKGCENIGLRMKRFGLLQDCDFVHEAGYFAGVEYVCCPGGGAEPKTTSAPPPSSPPSPKPKAKIVASSPIDTEDDKYQQYLTVSTDLKRSEHSRYEEARHGLKHHQIKRENVMVGELRQAEERVARVSSRDPESASRLLAEVEKQFRRAFMSLELEERAERQQLDAVHQQRVHLHNSRRIHHLRILLHRAAVNGNANSAKHHLDRVVNLVAREIARVANRASRLSKRRLTAAHLQSLRSYSRQLEQELTDLQSDTNLIRLLSDKVVKTSVAKRAEILNKARTLLHDAVANDSDENESGGKFPPKLASRFFNLLELYHKQANKMIKAIESRKQAVNKHGATTSEKKKDTTVKRVVLPSATGRIIDVARLPNENWHTSGRGSHSYSNSGHRSYVGKYPKQVVRVNSSRSRLSVSPVLIGILCALGALLLIATVALIVVRVAVGNADARRKGYTQPLVDDTHEPSVADCKAAFDYPTVKPQRAMLPDQHLAAMQINGYENPTYKFYEQ